MYDVTPKIKTGMNVRADHRKDSADIGDLNFGDHATGTLIYTVQTDGEALEAKAGDKWLKIDSAINGWVAIVHNGIEYCTVTNGETIPTGNFPDRVRWTDLDTGQYADYERKL